MTNDIERRLFEHQSGEHLKSFTFTRRPVKLVFCEDFNDVNQAIAFEKQLKGWTRKKKEAVINNYWDKLHELSQCKNITHFKNKKS